MYVYVCSAPVYMEGEYLYLYIYIYISISIYLYLYIYTYIYISIYLYICIHPSIHPSIYLSLSMIIYQSVHSFWWSRFATFHSHFRMEMSIAKFMLVHGVSPGGKKHFVLGSSSMEHGWNHQAINIWQTEGQKKANKNLLLRLTTLRPQKSRPVRVDFPWASSKDLHIFGSHHRPALSHQLAVACCGCPIELAWIKQWSSIMYEG